MANDYDVIVQYETVEFLGGTQTRPVIAVGVRTQVHQVYFEFRLPKGDYNSANVKNDATGYTIIYELLFTIPGVVDVEWTQEPTAGGQLEDHVVVYIESSSGNSTTSIDFPYSHFTQQYIAARVAFAINGLDNAEYGISSDQGRPPVYGIDYGPPAGERATREPGQGVITVH
ncbi:MAG TPA: hypothetical protein VH279_07285 [Solirubrobacteraceae bacterium]|jgi:hypothetical protein|nr:hypothetical protein [Solirubrobacteraceae bacterium]